MKKQEKPIGFTKDVGWQFGLGKTFPYSQEYLWEFMFSDKGLAIWLGELQNKLEKHSNEELFEKKKYKWTGTTSLGAYLVSATSSHYDWALKLMKKAKKP